MAIGSLGRRSTRDRTFSRFRGGLVWDTDATEIRDDQASDALNVDFFEECVRKRRGKSAYNTSFGAGAILGALAYYPKTGTRLMLAAWGTVVKADTGSGTFSDILTGLTAGAAAVDLIQYKDQVYIGNGIDSVYKWGGSGSAAAVALLAAPTTLPALTLRQTVIETFDSATTDASDPSAGWVVSGSGITLTAPTDIEIEGTACLKMSCDTGSRGSSIRKNFSAGARDLSTAEELVVWVYSEKVGLTFQIGIMKDGETTVDYTLFPTFTTSQRDTWVPVRVPLARVNPADREASPGLGIKFIDKRSNQDFPVALYFDQAMPAGPLPVGRTQYCYTHAEGDANGVIIDETNPSPTASVDIAAAPPPEGVKIVPAFGGATRVNLVGIYRFDESGTFRRFRRIATLPHDATQLDGAVNASVTTFTVDSSFGMSPGNLLTVGTERVQVRRVTSSTVIEVIRGADGTTAGSHADNAAVTPHSHFDARSPGDIALEDPEELVTGRTTPPVAKTYALVNHRLVCGGVTLSGTYYPWRVYVSREGYPEEFSETQDPDDPAGSGWFDLPEKDPIVRIKELDGAAIIVCSRSIWTLEGTGFDNYRVRKRADFGLDAREAICIAGRLIYLLAADGVRVVAPNLGFPGTFDSWVISEPVNSRLRAIPASSRDDACMGVDERGRILLGYTAAGASANDPCLVFDPLVPGALKKGAEPLRPGWTYYTNIDASRFVTLRRGGGDNGQILAGDPGIGRLWRLFTDSTGADIETDDGGAIAWHWQGKADDAKLGRVIVIDQAEVVLDDQSGVSVTIEIVLDRGNDSSSVSKTLGSDTALSRVGSYFGPDVAGRYVQQKVSGSHSVAMVMRQCAWAGFVRAA